MLPRLQEYDLILASWAFENVSNTLGYDSEEGKKAANILGHTAKYYSLQEANKLSEPG